MNCKKKKKLKEEKIKIIRQLKTDKVFETIENSFMPTQTIMVKREVINKIGLFDERLDCAEDRDWYLRIIKNFNIIGVNRPLVLIHSTFESISKNVKKKIKSEMYFIDKWSVQLIEQKQMGRYLFRLGVLFIYDGQFNRAKFWIKRSMMFPPKFFKKEAYYISLQTIPKILRRILIKRSVY